VADIYAVNIEGEIEESAWEKLVYRTSEERRERINQYKFSKDKKACLFAERLIYYYIKEIKHRDDISLIYNRYGKPILKKHKEVNFNISHSGSWVVCAFGHKELGVDIEKIGNVNLQVAKRFFHELEYDKLQAYDTKNQVDYFFYLWTLKECYIKAIGTGLHTPLNSFYFQGDASDIILLGTENMSTYKFYSKRFMNDYQLSLCLDYSESFSPEENIHLVDMNELISLNLCL